MAKNKSLNNMFEQFDTKKEEIAEVVEATPAVEQEQSIQEAQDSVTEVTEGSTEEQETVKANTELNDYQKELKEALKKSYDAKYKRPTVNDTHTRNTFLLENDLNKRLNKLSKGKRGFKTEFLNTAVRQLLDIMENN